MGDMTLGTRVAALASATAADPAGPGSVGMTLTLSAEHLRGQHVALHRSCWRCERVTRADGQPAGEAEGPSEEAR